MRFSDPAYLWLLLLVPALLLPVLRTEHTLHKIRLTFVRRRVRPRHTRRVLRVLCPLLTLSATIVSLSGPAVEVKRPVSISNHISLAIGIDVSKSMLAEDVVLEGGAASQFGVSNRINLARQFATDLMNELGEEQVGLFFFAKNGVEVVPPTRDHGFLRYVLKHTNASELTESGSDLRAAMQSGLSMLTGSGQTTVQALVLITDGEDTENELSPIVETAASFITNKQQLFCVGVGKDKQVFIPIRKKGFTEVDGFYMDKQGRYLQTRQEENTLREVSASARGQYLNLSSQTSPQAARTLVEELTQTASDTVPDVSTDKTWLYLAPLLLGTALLTYTGFLLL